jgi:glycine cleavage system aminomethyltransferase T
MLPIEYEALGTELEVDHPTSGRVKAVVSPKPAFDPSKEIPKQ